MRSKLKPAQSYEIAAKNPEVLWSLYRVSRALGWLGVLLPVMLIIHGLFLNGGLPLSISHSYHTAMGDIFVGTLFAIGVFLFFYKDFNPEEYASREESQKKEMYWDRVFAKVAGASAIGLALFPVDPLTISACIPKLRDSPNILCTTGGITFHGDILSNNFLHFLPAATFFISICVICIRFFPDEPMKARYLGRNEEGDYDFELGIPTKRTGLFWFLGAVMALCLVGLASMSAYAGSDNSFIQFLEHNSGFFWLEVIAVGAFAMAWLAKSEDFRLIISA